MKKRVDVYLVLLFIWFTLDITGLTVKEFNLVRGTGFFSVNGIWWGTFFILMLIYFLFDRRGHYLMIAFLSFWTIVQYFNHWHFKIFGEQVPQEKIKDNTIQLIPISEKIVLPDIYHLILHGLMLITLVLLLIYMYKSSTNKAYFYFKNQDEVVKTEEVSTEVIS